ncbi:hypothetical protein AOQ84DRAFT_381278 [Glonium stellatum]|uniref:Myb-like domain-containing protein n=1 Tax=Glonium stellatum TaxID=574774 RepID=A0A8E2JP06_9PEZI|nr:hypothetical protein AOQ84DRAFT_381278 [Glonium stellatum]
MKIDLTTVEEDEGSQNPEIAEEAAGTPPPEIREEPQPHRSPGEFSNISGTTAISSLSIAEADELDADMMVDNIADLHREAEKFLRLIAPDQARSRDFQNIVKELRIPESKTSERFRFSEDTFGKYLELFRTAPHDFIRPQVVRHSFFGVQQSHDPLSERLDAVIYKANLAVLAKHVITSERGQDPAWNALRELDSSFPLLFLSSFSDSDMPLENTKAGASVLLTDTFNLALEIRTQLAILLLSRAQDQSAYDPEKELEQVFFTTRRGSSASDDDHNTMRIRGWDIRGLGGDGTELLFKDDVIRRVNEIRHFFARDPEPLQPGDRVDFDALGAKYSWDVFIIQALNWVRLRNREIQSLIKISGSVDDLSDSLRDVVNSINADRASLDSVPQGTPRGQRTSTGSGQRSAKRRSRPSFDPKKSLHLEAIRLLGPRPKRPAGQVLSKNPVRVEAQRKTLREPNPSEEDDIWQPAPDNNEYDDAGQAEILALSAPSSSARTLSRIRRQERNEPENRRRFIDPQRDPERVEWQDGFDQSQSTQRTNRKGKSSQGASKRRLEIEEESSDDGFEQGTSERRRQVPKAKRARFAEPSTVPPSHQPGATQRDEDYSPSARDSTPEASAEGTAMVPSSSAAQYTHYGEVKALAKKHASQRARLNNQARRARNPWSEEACQALIEYIGDIGCSWRDIKRHDEEAGHRLLEDRTQVDLKDKARNLKAEFLKAGCGLPPGFEDVSLGPRMENQLRNGGVHI